MLKIRRPDGGDWPLPSQQDGPPFLGEESLVLFSPGDRLLRAPNHLTALLFWLMLVMATISQEVPEGFSDLLSSRRE